MVCWYYSYIYIDQQQPVEILNHICQLCVFPSTHRENTLWENTLWEKVLWKHTPRTGPDTPWISNLTPCLHSQIFASFHWSLVCWALWKILKTSKNWTWWPEFWSNTFFLTIYIAKSGNIIFYRKLEMCFAKTREGGHLENDKKFLHIGGYLCPKTSLLCEAHTSKQARNLWRCALKAAKLQRTKLKNKLTNLSPCGKRNAEKTSIWLSAYFA